MKLKYPDHKAQQFINQVIKLMKKKKERPLGGDWKEAERAAHLLSLALPPLIILFFIFIIIIIR